MSILRSCCSKAAATAAAAAARGRCSSLSSSSSSSSSLSRGALVARAFCSMKSSTNTSMTSSSKKWAYCISQRAMSTMPVDTDSSSSVSTYNEESSTSVITESKSTLVGHRNYHHPQEYVVNTSPSEDPLVPTGNVTTEEAEAFVIESGKRQIELMGEKEIDRAIDIAQSNVNFAEKYFDGQPHEVLAATYNNLALAYHEDAQQQEAVYMYENAVNVYKKSVGFEHRYTATCLYNLSTLHKEMRNYAAAVAVCSELIEVQKVICGEHSFQVGHSLSWRGSVEFMRNYTDESIRDLLAAINILIHYDHLALADAMWFLGHIYQKEKDLIQAVTLMKNAYRFRLVKLGLDHPITQETKMVLEDIQEYMFRNPEAYPYGIGYYPTSPDDDLLPPMDLFNEKEKYENRPFIRSFWWNRDPPAKG